MGTSGQGVEGTRSWTSATARSDSPSRRHRLQDRFAAQARLPVGVTDLDLDALPAALRVLLLHDGTLVTSLEALRLTQVVVEVGVERDVVLDHEQACSLAAAIGTPALSRPAVLRDAATGEALVSADSLLLRERLPGAFARRLATAEKGIGAALREARVEHRRELLWCGVASSPSDLDSPPTAGAHGMVVRCYRLIHRGRPAVCIRETFLAGVGHWPGS